MPIKVLMPALSPTMKHGNLARWLKKEGDKIKPGEVIAEIETDKATMEVESVDEGKIAKILVKEGTQDVAVNTLIAVVLEEEESEDDLEKFISTNTKQATEAKPAEDEKVEDSNNSQNKKLPDNNKQSEKKNSVIDHKPSSRIFASPLAKRIAYMEHINLSNISGSGPAGRIVKTDVLEAISNLRQTKGKVMRNGVEYNSKPHTSMRRVIAKRLVESKQKVPHFYLSIECCVDDLLKSRAQINEKFADEKFSKISVNDFVILASAKALEENPEANASWSDEVTILYNNIDISVAVAIDGGLITPVIQNANQKDIFTLSKEMKNLAQKAKQNKLTTEEYTGGGFSISNLGMYGIDNFNAIINPPQSCILAVGASVKKPIIIDDQIVVKNIMNVSLSCDHRVVDGVLGAKFLASFKRFIESPILMFL
ncbi:MAG TPA: pyruvate dehydrogenase complex dihydrolipoamide acetyltransferase [Candidatus Megaira endosymbiont of Nemacystus decipiens]|nr:pyruvate dehydrogenase complex dihydrolipoamide acetyltransferase [Candidatus Megaera endosymbiont of Nemacystus decipiens]